jgi:hypothetical protein
MGFVEMKNTPSEASSSAENQKSTKVSKENQDEDFIGKQVSPLRTIEAFLRSLTSASADGRILAQPTNVSFV